MKAIIIGAGGHIGYRRAKLLYSLGFSLVLCDTRGLIYRVDDISDNKYLENSYISTSAEESIKNHPDAQVVLVCTPPDTHVSIATMAAEARMNVFIEKPLADTFDVDGITRLVETLQAQGRWAMMGQSYRFLPSLREFRRSFIDHDLIAAEIWSGQHLADWHPGEDYKTSYTARIGVVYESLAHSLDLCNWLFGEIHSISALIANSGTLGIDAADTATCLVRMASGAQVTVHADFLQRPRDFHINVVTTPIPDPSPVVTGEGNVWAWRFDPSEAERMYAGEMQAMQRALGKDLQPQPDIYQGIATLDWINSAVHSSNAGTWGQSSGLWKKLAKRVEA